MKIDKARLYGILLVILVEVSLFGGVLLIGHFMWR